MIYLVSGIAIIFCILYFHTRNSVIQENTKIKAINDELFNTNSSLLKEYNKLKLDKETLQSQVSSLDTDVKNQQSKVSGLREAARAQEAILNSYKKTVESLKQNADSDAKAEYQRRLKEYEVLIDQKKQSLNQEVEEIKKLVKQEEEKVQDLQRKQLAYIEDKKREEEMQVKLDYYRMMLEDTDIKEIKMLRELQNQFTKKEVIDKIIWENYYKAPYDVLMAHIFSGSSKVCGIYKITNIENGQAYIGQSVDCKERARQHIKNALSSAPTTNKLYQQMKKYGPENFTFEIIEAVDRSKLNEREIYWIDFYKTRDFGMNVTRGGS